MAQQQCVGPLHTPLADVAVVAFSPLSHLGIATAIGEQPLKGLVRPEAGGRMSLAEALTNLVFARVTDLKVGTKCCFVIAYVGAFGLNKGGLWGFVHLKIYHCLVLISCFICLSITSLPPPTIPLALPTQFLHTMAGCEVQCQLDVASQVARGGCMFAACLSSLV